jgi:hypothetical protein
LGAELFTENSVLGIALGEFRANQLLGLFIGDGDRRIVPFAFDGERIALKMFERRLASHHG